MDKSMNVLDRFTVDVDESCRTTTMMMLMMMMMLESGTGQTDITSGVDKSSFLCQKYTIK